MISTQASLDTVVVDLPTNHLDALRDVPGVRAATRDMRVHLSSVPSVARPGDISNVAEETGATNYWDSGFFGQGVDVALLDSGVLPVDGLMTPNKLVIGPDLVRAGPKRCAASTPSATAPTWPASSPAWTQARPTAIEQPLRRHGTRVAVVSIKLADADGGVDVSQVIAAIDWVVQHRNDNGLNIRVLNLSYGTDSAQPYQVDPLAYAVEQAWKAGIFVVAATGNAGYQFKTGTLADPAYDPKIFAVGATDAQGTMSTSDDTVASFSSTGSNGRYVDVVNPGSHLVSLRVPGSYIDQTFGSSGYVSDGLFRGSGTSEAAAFTSGEAALAIQQRPDITPGN